jgi:tryptophan synthase beta chain
MFTLGHNFMPSPIHAGGLRYHGAGVVVSQLLKDGLIEAVSQNQQRCFEAGMQFIKTEGIIPAPESTHAIATVIDEANRCREEGISKTILFNLSGHGLFDMAAYEMFMSGKLNGEKLVSDQSIADSIKMLEALQPSGRE